MTRLHVVMAGSSGFLGGHLRAELERRGHRVTALVRRPERGPAESRWDPDADRVDTDLVGSADVVVNLAGSPTLGNPWSRRWARRLRESRLRTTGLLAETIAAAARTGTPPAFVAGNGVGWYGDHGGAVLTEDADTRGHAFMTAVCREWQAATGPAAAAGARVAVLRTAPVMDRTSPPLKQQLLQFRLGLGGRLGSGRQHMPMISLRDWVGAAAYVVEHPTASGPVNLCCVETPTNAEYTATLAAAVGRPALLHAPRPAVRAAGRMTSELLGSVRTRPEKLLALGYEFRDPDVTAVVRAGVAGAR